jgi:hypothetical protein
VDSIGNLVAASINDVTDDLAIDALCGTAAFNGTWVAVEAGTSPTVREGSQG